MIAYLLLTGVKPFSGSSDQEVFRKIKAGNPPYNDLNWLNRSDESKDFVKQLLELDVDNRFSAADAIKHPWLLENGFIKVKPDAVHEALSNLRNFRHGHEFKRSSYAFIGG